MSLSGCQINPIDLNFYLQKSLEIFDTSSANKIQSQNYKVVKVPCLMPIKVNVMAHSFPVWITFFQLNFHPKLPNFFGGKN